jgi:Lrp/AsnC family transcriptional regulator
VVAAGDETTGVTVRNGKGLDCIDRRIIALLQVDATLSLVQISHAVGLSPSPCWKRIQRLETEGIISARVALVDPGAVGLGLTAYVAVEMAEHSEAELERFTQAVIAMPEVLELHRMAGDVDYLLKIAVADTDAFTEFYRRLIVVGAIRKVTSRFAMERLKMTTALPIPAHPRGRSAGV